MSGDPGSGLGKQYKNHSGSVAMTTSWKSRSQESFFVTDPEWGTLRSVTGFLLLFLVLNMHIQYLFSRSVTSGPKKKPESAKNENKSSFIQPTVLFTVWFVCSTSWMNWELRMAQLQDRTLHTAYSSWEVKGQRRYLWKPEDPDDAEADRCVEADWAKTCYCRNSLPASDDRGSQPGSWWIISDRIKRSLLFGWSGLR